MTIGIIGFEEQDAALLDRTMEDLIKDQFFLFNVAIGSNKSEGAKWADRNGAPKVYVTGDLRALVRMCDYLLILNTDEDKTKVIINECKRFGKHGKVVSR